MDQLLVYVDWAWFSQPKLMGLLERDRRGQVGFRFDENWLETEKEIILDSDLKWTTELQFPKNKGMFKLFWDREPDSWSTALMRRNEKASAKYEGRDERQFDEFDLLQRICDEGRVGAFRFKRREEDDFLDHTGTISPWTGIEQLQGFVMSLEDQFLDAGTTSKQTAVLLPGVSSLGGKRPKINVIDEYRDLWIAKFPKYGDAVDVSSWEYLVYRLAELAVLEMPPAKLQFIEGDHGTFFSKRFDRYGSSRNHFSTAQVLLGDLENPSYLDLVDFIRKHGAQPEIDLYELWKRMVFNIMISNADDGLFNHGFLLSRKGWKLAPPYDLNASVGTSGLSLSIDRKTSAFDLGAALAVAPAFDISEEEARETIAVIQTAVATWESVAGDLAIPEKDLEKMYPAFMMP